MTSDGADNFVSDMLVRRCPQCEDLLALGVQDTGAGHRLAWVCSECDLDVDDGGSPRRRQRSQAEWDLLIRYAAVFAAAAYAQPRLGRIQLRRFRRSQSCRPVRKQRRP